MKKQTESMLSLATTYSFSRLPIAPFPLRLTNVIIVVLNIYNTLWRKSW